MVRKSNSEVYPSKQMLFFHLFLPYILSYVKKCTQSSECYCCFLMLQLTDRLIPEITRHTKRKEYDLNVTLTSFFLHYCYKLLLKLPQKQISITLF